MQQLDVFLSRLNPWVPGCPEPVARQALVDSAIAFCEDTNVVRYLSDCGPLRAGQSAYDIDLPPDTNMARVLRAWVNDEPIPMAAHLMINDRAAYDGSHPGRPRWAVSVERDTINLTPAPRQEDAGKHLRLLVATRPTMDARQVDDALFHEWAEPVVMGAVHRLTMAPGTSYTSADLAVVAAAKYAQGASRARVERNHGRGVTNSRVQARTFRGGA